MKKIIFLLLIILSINYSNAQTGNRDSIIQLLQNDKEDTNRVIDLANLSYEYLESKPDTTLILALEALALANRIGFEKGKAISLNRIGNAYGSVGNYAKEMEVYLQALQINEKINNIDGIQRNLGNIGTIYNNQEVDYRTALSYLFKAKALAEQINNKRSLAIVLVNIGSSYLGLKIYDSAKLYTQQSYDVAFQINYTRQIGSGLYHMGQNYFETEQNSLALDNYRLSIPYSLKAQNYLRLCDAFLGMGKVFEKMQQNDSVLFYAKYSLVIAKEKEFTQQLRDAARFLSHYYRKVNADSAFFYQDISRTANDSLFSKQKQRQFQNLSFDEKLRQQEIASTELRTKEERKRNLQYAAIALGLITFVILFLLMSHSIVANQKLIRFFGVVALLMVFEFINLYIHPYLSHATNDSPLLMLLVMVCIASMLVPVHHWMENWITHQLVEKNKKIRLAAAKKTIATLEGEQTN
jgi:tetratricopeptide (TPR) repeat protein